jgi:hypothetical protein
MSHRKKKSSILQRCRKQYGKMLNVYLECFKFDGKLLEILADSGTFTPSQTYIIMHNMVIQDESGMSLEPLFQ